MYLPTRTVTLEAPARPGGSEAEPGSLGTGTETRPAPTTDGRRTRRAHPWRGLDRNVYLLGTTSMVTDIATEMVAVVLPLYLTGVFGFSPAQFGAFDGVYTAVAAVACVATALVADRRQRHKAVAAAGYSLSAAAKLGLVLATGRWVPTVAVVYADRLGKGIRTAPRDAILSLSSTPARLAESFGVHRALDTAGAVIGPFVAALLLARDPSGFDTIFLVAFFVSLVGVAVLLLLVDDRRVATRPSGPDPGSGPSRRHRSAGTARPLARSLWADRRYRSLGTAAVVLALATPGDALVFLAYQRQSGLSLAVFPLLFVGASLVFLAAAIPLGRLADRIGRGTVFLAGQLALVGALTLLAAGGSGPLVLGAFLGLLGVHLAATDGVLMSMVSATVTAAARTTGLAVLVTAGALANLVASVGFGAVWSAAGIGAAAATFAAALAIATGASAVILRRPREVLR